MILLHVLLLCPLTLYTISIDYHDYTTVLEHYRPIQHEYFCFIPIKYDTNHTQHGPLANIKSKFHWDAEDRLNELEIFKEEYNVLFEGPYHDLERESRQA